MSIHLKAARVLTSVTPSSHDTHFNLTVQTVKSKKKLQLICRRDFFSKYAFFEEGDMISGIVEPKEGIYEVSMPPLVLLGTDPETIKYCFRRALSMGEGSTERLYGAFVEHLKSDEDTVARLLDDLCERFFSGEGSEIFNEYIPQRGSYLHPAAMQNLCRWWKNFRLLRQLNLLGMTDKDQKSSKLRASEFIRICLENPYRIGSISLDVADQIMVRQLRDVTPDQRRKGEILRKMESLMTERAWTCIPLKYLRYVFPDFSSHLEGLLKEYDMKLEFDCLYTSYAHMCETTVSNHFRRLLDQNHLDRPPLQTYNAKITEEQRQAVDLAFRSKLMVITGGAGTGKTTVIAELVENLRGNKIPYYVVSFTGKAVARVKELLTEGKTSTFHRLMATSKKEKIEFAHLIVDESSMVTVPLFYEFLCHFTQHFAITLVGDCNQLAPIEWGGLFEQVIGAGSVPIVKLTTCHRTLGEENTILLNANRIIEGMPVEEMWDEDLPEPPTFAFEAGNNFQLFEGDVTIVKHLLKQMKEAGLSVNDIRVIIPYKEEVTAINLYCQQLWLSGAPEVYDKAKQRWMLGDRVMMTENNYIIDVMNGEEGVITAIGDQNVKVKFGSVETDMAITWTNEETVKGSTRWLQHAYALTVHKAQGSEWSYVIVYCPPGKKESGAFLNRNLVYTSITRARHAVFCVNQEYLERAAFRKPFTRCENLIRRLKVDDA